MRSLWRLFALILPVVLIAAPVLSVPANAHVFLFKSVPGDGEVLTTPPTQIMAEFTSPLYPQGSVIAVFDAAGARLDNLDTALDPADPRKMVVTLPLLAPGWYHVTWTAVDAEDGHASEGAFDISVAGGDSAPATAAVADPLPAPIPTAVANETLTPAVIE